MISIISGIILLCVLVVVHEGGHFLVAKALGVKVLTFSVGFGPKLIKWTRGGTEYCLSAIPLGGYVKMVGESPTEELTEDEKKVSFLHQPLWKKSAIALAGPLFNLVLPIILFWFVYIGAEKVVLPVVGTTISGDPAAVAGILPGDQIVSVNGVAVSTFNDVIKEISSKPSQKIALEIARHKDGALKRQKIEIQSSASPDPNPVNIGENVGRIGIMPSVRRAKIAVLDSSLPAAKAGLRTFDEVIAINSVPIASYDELENKLRSLQKPFSVTIERSDENAKKSKLDFTVAPSKTSPAALVVDPQVARFAVIESETLAPKYVEQLAKTQANLKSFLNTQPFFGMSFEDGVISEVKEKSAAANVGLKRGDRVVSVNGVAVDSWFQIQRLFESHPDDMQMLGIVSQGKGRIVALRLQNPATKPSALEGLPRKELGVSIDDLFKQGALEERHVGAFGALKRGFESTYDLIKLTAKSLMLLFSFAVPVSQIGGPIMIFDVAGQAASQGLQYYIFIMSLVSVNLGLLNLLPIPVLDGGHLMMFFIEFVIRRPLSLKARQIATQVGMAFVIGLMLIAIFNDISRLAS